MIGSPHFRKRGQKVLVGPGGWLFRQRSGASASAADGPTYWLDAAYDRRIVVDATNAQAIALHDHLLDATDASFAAIDSDSLRVVEITSIDTVDRAYDWRYPQTVNHFWYLPASVSGTTVTIKAPGKWAAGETRSFALYWDSTSAVTLYDHKHLDGIVQTWTYTVGGTLTVGDVYKLVVGPVAAPTTYTHTAIGGDTTTTIAQDLRSQANAGAVATVAGAAAILTVTQTSKLDGTFTVASTGSTLATGTVTIVKPNWFGVGRVGPDTAQYNAAYAVFGLPYFNPVSSAMTRVAFGGATNHVFRLGAYSINGVGAQASTSSTVATCVNDGPKVRATGVVTFANTKWSAAWSAVVQHKVVTGRKSDDTGTDTLDKFVNVARVSLVYTCDVAYTPTAVLDTATALGSHELLAMASLANTFGGNATEIAGNKYLGGDSSSSFSAPLSTGTITAYDASADLSALAVADTLIGAHGNAVTGGIVLVSAPVLANFGSQSPEAKWTAQGNAFGVLHLRNLVTTSTIPQGATVTLDFWIIDGKTSSATTAGDALLPDEMVALAQSLTDAQPTVAVAATETYADGVAETMALAGSRAVDGIAWFQTNAVALTTVAGNGGYAYQVKTATVTTSDDDDGNYGEAFKLAGLCLRYLRTGDAALIAPIELQVAYHIAIEAAAVAAYGGTFWSGSAPYWYWPSATPASGLTTEGGVSNGDTDPGMPGGVKGTINYTQGQVRRLTSVDQLHIVGIGLYHYCYLLRNSSAITANTTLRTTALALLGRMATFEAAHIVNTSCVLTNLFRICSGLTPLYANGITDTEFNDASAAALATPYWGASDSFAGWQVSNTDGGNIIGNSNVALDSFFRAQWAPGSTVAGVTRYLRGVTHDMTATDSYHHDTIFGTATWNTKYTSSVFPSFPVGWMLRSDSTSNVFKWTSGRTGDDHFLSLSGGTRDSMSGRAAQRLAALCFAYLVGGAYSVPVEQNTTTTLRSIALASEIDGLAATLAVYGPEPSTRAQRKSVAGHLGEPSASYDPQIADSAFTGYWMFASELWQLVRAGANYATYYPIGMW